MLVIGGRHYNESRQIWSSVSDVELLTFDETDDDCTMPDLDEVSYGHASVTSSMGAITCAGIQKKGSQKKPSTKCVIQYNGETNSFPSMVGRRFGFGILNLNETLFSIGGAYIENLFQEPESFKTMETMNLNYEKKWRQEKMPFNVQSHCMVNIGSKIYVIGGWNGVVSKII